MFNSLLEIEPNVVSRDLRGYSFFFYGDAKTGKTTIASHFDKSLLLAYEIGFKTIPGIKPKKVLSWSESLSVLKELEDPRVKEVFHNVIIDTVDIAYGYCEKYICDSNEKDTIADFGYGKGYKLLGKEFDRFLRKILQLGYGLILISHAKDKTIKLKDGTEFSQIQPTIDNLGKEICERTCDVIGYVRSLDSEDGINSTKLFLRGTSRFEAGTRFKYLPEVIDFNYNSLVEAVHNAIDKEAEEHSNKYITEDQKNSYEEDEIKVDFNELKETFQSIVNNLIEKDAEENAKKIRSIIVKYLGRDKTVAECNESQTEALKLIVSDLKDL